MNIQKLLASSSDPKKLSMTIKAVLLALVPVFIVVTGMQEADVLGFIDQIVDVVFYGSALVSAFMGLYGLARKAYLGRWSAVE